MKFHERLDELIKEKHTTRYKVLQDLGMNKSSILNWNQRDMIPSGEKARSACKVFQHKVKAVFAFYRKT